MRNVLRLLLPIACALDLPVVPDSSVYWFDQDELSPLFQVTAITQEQPYNTNQNWLDLEYYATYDFERDLKRFYATLTLHLEQP